MSSENYQVGQSIWGIGPKAELFDRAMSLGYTQESAARVADSFYAVSGIVDPCPTHPGMSTSIRDGYTVDSCEACDVISMSTDAGYTVPTEVSSVDTLAEAEAILADAGKTWGDKTRAPRWGDAAMVGKVWTASGRMVDDVPAEVSGVEILTDLLTLEPVAEVPTFNVVKAHKMSAPMVSVALAVSAMRGQVDAWHMHNVILPESTKATKATVRALIRRGILAEVTGDNDGTPGSLVAYRLTDTGCDIVAALGCPVTFLPADPSEADTYVRRAAVRPGDCSDGCETVSARSLPVGGTVCLGCGSTFTRTGEDTHPGTLAVSEAVVRRNLARITADIEI